jgi:hypothetical protein
MARPSSRTSRIRLEAKIVAFRWSTRKKRAPAKGKLAFTWQRLALPSSLLFAHRRAVSVVRGGMSAGRTAHPPTEAAARDCIDDRIERYLATAGVIVKLRARLHACPRKSRAHSEVATRRRIPTRLPSRPVRAGWSHLPSKDIDMQNGRKPPRPIKPGPPPISGPKQWTPNTDRAKQNGFGSAQRSYERYLALAQEEARSGNIVAAENYYQHAEHYYRSMSPNRGGTSS